MTIRIVKVVPNVLGNGYWRIHDEHFEIDETIDPNTILATTEFGNLTLREAIGARPHMHFKAKLAADGWRDFKRYKKRVDW